MTRIGLGVLLAGCSGEEAAPPPPTEEDERLRYVDCTYDRAGDDGVDGVVDDTYHGEYDGNGYLAIYEHRDGDGTLVFASVEVNDAFGNSLELSMDTDGDGVFDDLTVGEYDSDGNPIRILQDLGGDGEDDVRTTYEVSGGLVRSGRIRGIGSYAVQEQDLLFVYDGQDRLVGYDEIDASSDQLDTRFTYTYAGASDLVVAATYEDWWGEEDFRGGIEYAWTYDRLERVATYREAILPGSGVDIEAYDEAYDYAGEAPEPASSVLVRTVEGIETDRWTKTWTYDAAWRSTSYSDGEYRSETTWACP